MTDFVSSILLLARECKRLGAQHAPEIIIHPADFARIKSECLSQHWKHMPFTQTNANPDTFEVAGIVFRRDSSKDIAFSGPMTYDFRKGSPPGTGKG